MADEKYANPVDELDRLINESALLIERGNYEVAGDKIMAAELLMSNIPNSEHSGERMEWRTNAIDNAQKRISQKSNSKKGKRALQPIRIEHLAPGLCSHA